MMTRRQPIAMRLLILKLLWLVPAGQGRAQIAPPAESPLELLMAPMAPRYETLDSVDGDILSILSTRYGDGTLIRHPVHVTLGGFPLSLEVTLLDPVVPTPQTVRVPTPQQGSSVAPGLPSVNAEHLRQLSRTIDFGPGAPFEVIIRQAQGFVGTDLLLADRTRWEPFAPHCLKDEWLGFARLRPREGVTEVAPSMRGRDGVEKGNTSFKIGEFVCVSFETLGEQ